MRKLLRLVVLVAVAGALVAGGVTAVAVAAAGVWNHGGTADFETLAPLGITASEASTVYAADGTTVLGVFQGAVNRKPVPISQVSPVLVKSVVDTEDHKFYLHGGFDIPSTLRAAAANGSNSGVQGGSTITQQLVKQLYLTSQQKLSRKIKEAVIAQRLQEKYSKNQILEAYLNVIYLGNGAYGVEAAANEYFGEDVSQITLPQAALLAGLIQDPTGYDPLLNPAAARIRRSQVLDHMVQYHSITRAQADAANATPLPTAIIKPQITPDQIDSYYVQEVETELLSAGSPLGATYQQRYQALFYGGLKIYTNLNPALQVEAEQAVQQGTPPNSGGYQEAMVTIDPATGKVEAMVGGAGAASQFDIVTQGQRQPGSGFKIFTLLAALSQGYSPFDSINGSSPCAVDFPTDHDLLGQPAHNDEGNGGGVLTLVNATAQSTNCAFIRLAHEVGLPNVANMAHALGVTEQVPLFPSIVIGSVAVKPIEMAAAYATVADYGIYHKPSFVDHIVDRSGGIIHTGEDPGHRVFSVQVAEEADVCFQQVLINGTAGGQGLGRPSAGKTGTTENNDDAWFNGYTPQLESTVWMGNEQTEKPIFIPGHGLVFGADYPAHTWHNFMTGAVAPLPPVGFAPPDPALIPPTEFITSPGLQRDDRSPLIPVPVRRGGTAAAPARPAPAAPPPAAPPPAAPPPGAPAGGPPAT